MGRNKSGADTLLRQWHMLRVGRRPDGVIVGFSSVVRALKIPFHVFS
jgi:hypothetical protein